MPTKGWKRTWVKLFVTGWLHGSIRWQLEPDERSVWADLICLAGQCGHDGVICDNDGEPLPRYFIASQLNIKQTLLDRTIAKSIHDNRLEEVDGRLSIVNWTSYQSEYERQKLSRKNKSLDELNQEYLAKHPEKVTGSVEMEGYVTEEVYDGDPYEEELARGSESLEEHEQALMQQNPNVKKFKEKLESQDSP